MSVIEFAGLAATPLALLGFVFGLAYLDEKSAEKKMTQEFTIDGETLDEIGSQIHNLSTHRLERIHLILRRRFIEDGDSKELQFRMVELQVSIGTELLKRIRNERLAKRAKELREKH